MGDCVLAGWRENVARVEQQAWGTIYSTGPIPRLWNILTSRDLYLLSYRLRFASIIALAALANVVKPSSWNWLSIIIRPARLRPIDRLMSQREADQINPFSCSLSTDW